MRVLVTGSAGFLGRHVCAYLSQQGGYEVTQFDNYEHLSGHPCLRNRDQDVTNYEHIFHKAIEADAIVHLAAFGRNLTCQNYPYNAWQVNVNGTLNVLTVAQKLGLKRVVVCSSNITLSKELTVYRESKRAVEQLIKLYASLGVSVMGLRPSNIAGPGQSRTEYQPCSFAALDMGFERDGHFSITGDGTQQRDFVNVRDVARAFAIALESPRKGNTMDVCTGRLASLNEVATLLKVPIKYVDPRPGDAKVLVSYPEEASMILGFNAKIGLQQTLEESFPAVMAARR